MTTAFAAPQLGLFTAVADTGIAEAVRGLFRATREQITYRRTLAELRALSPRELAELGISRFALPSIARDAARGN